MGHLKIGVFFSHENSTWKLLPEISEYLTEKQIIPLLGDRITSLGNDYKVMKLDSLNVFENVVTVQNRVLHYSEYDIAIICDYVVW